MKVRRFYYVSSPRSTTLHRKYGNTSEGLAACGRQVCKGWSYALPGKRRPNIRRCKQCEAAS